MLRPLVIALFSLALANMACAETFSGHPSADEMCTIQSPKPGCTPDPTAALPAGTKATLDEIAHEASARKAKCEVKAYPATEFAAAVRKAERELEAKLPSRAGCRYTTTRDLPLNLSRLSRVESKKVLEALTRLERQGLLRGAVARTPAGSEPGRCARQTFHLFTKDGYVLCLDYGSQG